MKLKIRNSQYELAEITKKKKLFDTIKKLTQFLNYFHFINCT